MSTVASLISGVGHNFPNAVNIARINRAIQKISKRLFKNNSNIVQGALSVTVSADTSSASLPSDYWGMIDWPYISGYKWRLRPVPNVETRLLYSDNSIPQFFEVKGQTIYLYPGTSSEITISGDYWASPTALTATTDTIPFNTLFDDTIVDALLRTPPEDGKRRGDEGEIMDAIINKSVDEIAPYRDKKSPVRVEDNMNLDFISNEDWY